MGATPAAPCAPAVGVLRARPPRSLHGKSTAPETPRRLAGANAPATPRMPSAELCGAVSGSGALLNACCWCRTAGQWGGRDSRVDEYSRLSLSKSQFFNTAPAPLGGGWVTAVNRFYAISI